MDYLFIYSLLTNLTIFLLFFFAFFLLTSRKGNTVAHRILAVFLIALAFSYLDGVFLFFSSFFFKHFPHVFYVGLTLEFLLGPTLYLFIKTRTNPSFAMTRKEAWHGLPFLLHLVYMSANFHIYSADAKRALLDAGAVFTHAEITTLIVLIHVHFSVYSILALLLLGNYQDALKESYSSEKALSLSWLRTITIGFFLIWGLRFLNSMLWLQVPDLPLLQHIDVRLFIVACVFIFACVLFFQALKRPEVIHYEEKVKYQTAQLSEAAKQMYLHKLQAYMEREKPYLDSSLDLRSLAEGVSIPPHYISQVLNGCLQQNFFDFVNGYRVRECQALLADPYHSHKNIAEVMYEVGFNSKSVFNTSFKKFSGMTPSQYRKSAIQPKEMEMLEG